jgi:peroxiredoxin
VECPWTRHYDDYLIERMAQWRDRGVTLALINSNANESVEEMRDMADAYELTCPVLHDAGNAVADAYGAITTPHIFVVNPSGLIIYQGAIDDRSFIRPEPTVNYLDTAVEALLAGAYPELSATASYGCTIVRGM